MNEIWKDIPNYEGIYQVSNLGRVKSLKKSIILKSCSVGGYDKVILYLNKTPKHHLIHRLVLQTFKPERYFEGAVCNHKNSIKNCNNLDNLEWCTQKENVNHSHNNGLNTILKGEEQSASKLTDKMVNIIRKNSKTKEFTQAELSRLFNVSTSTIYKVVHNKAWTHI